MWKIRFLKKIFSWKLHVCHHLYLDWIEMPAFSEDSFLWEHFPIILSSSENPYIKTFKPWAKLTNYWGESWPFAFFFLLYFFPIKGTKLSAFSSAHPELAYSRGRQPEQRNSEIRLSSSSDRTPRCFQDRRDIITPVCLMSGGIGCSSQLNRLLSMWKSSGSSDEGRDTNWPVNRQCTHSLFSLMSQSHKWSWTYIQAQALLYIQSIYIWNKLQMKTKCKIDPKKSHVIIRPH